MELYLTRQRNGLYMITLMEPVFSKVQGRDFEDAYVAPGEPVGMRNFCDLILKLVKIDQPLKRGQMVKIFLDGSVVS